MKKKTEVVPETPPQSAEEFESMLKQVAEKVGAAEQFFGEVETPGLTSPVYDADYWSTPEVRLSMEISVNFGDVSITMGKAIFVNPNTALEQHAEYDKIAQQLEYEIKEWGANRLASFRRR